MTVVHPLLARLFRRLDERGLRWTLLRVPDLAAPTGDVDVLVAPEDAGALRTAAESCGLVAVPGWDQLPNLLLVGYDRASDLWLQLDVVAEVEFRRPRPWPLTGLAAGVLGRHEECDGVRVPADGDAFWLLLLHDVLDKREIPDRARTRLRALATAAGESSLQAALEAAAAGAWRSADAVAAARDGRWDDLLRLGDQLATALAPRRARAARVRDAGRRLRRAARRPLLLRSRRGVSLVVLGPNGVGKSTLAAGLQATLPFESRVLHMGLWKAAGGSPPRAVLEILLRPFRVWLRWCVAQYHQARGRLVIFDRYVYEARLPAQPPLLALKKPYFWVLGHAVPHADTGVFLDVPGELAFARKDENTPEELESERLFYRGVVGAVPSMRTVNAARDADAVRAEVTGVLWAALRARWRGRHEQPSTVPGGES